ncbi:MAG: hypothetical protein K2Y26_18235 [Gemmatimonadaceae bacterium]|nr:hypothetical protein [Gemmatimonadaceae bacterium]
MSGSARVRPQDDERLIDSLRWYLVLVGAGAVVVLRFLLEGAAGPDSSSSQIFFRLLAVGEPFPIALAFMYSLLVLWQVQSAPAAAAGTHSPDACRPLGRRFVAAAVALSMTLTFAVAIGLHGAFPFSMDEWAVRFQSRLFLAGRIVGALDTAIPFLREVARPVFVFSTGDGNGWVSGYLPTYSLLLMPFEAIGYPWLLNVLCNAGSVLAVAHVGRQLWGPDDDRPVVAALALAASSQFMAAAATTYTMPAHLLVNLLWLAAMLGEGRAWLWAGPLALVALTLHQPVPHALFAAPFLARLLVERDWKRFAWILTWWIASGCVVLWWSGLMTGRLPTFGANGVLYWPNAATLVVLLLHVMLLFTWSSPLMPLLMLIGCRRWEERTKTERDLAAGIVLSLAFYLCFRLVTQGHGWGWRYGHQVLGSVALLAATGWPRFRAVVGITAARRWLALSLALSVFVLFPTRAKLMLRLSLPFAMAGEWLRSQPERYLVIPTDSLWYGQDLVRNEATLTSPVLLHGAALTGEELRVLENEQGRPVRRIRVDELRQFGIERLPRPHSK